MEVVVQVQDDTSVHVHVEEHLLSKCEFGVGVQQAVHVRVVHGSVQEILMHPNAVVLHACQKTLQVHLKSVGDVRIGVFVVVVDDHQIVEVGDNKRRVVKVRDQAVQVLVQMVEVLEHVSRYTSPVYCSCKSVRSVALLSVMVHVSATGR